MKLTRRALAAAALAAGCRRGERQIRLVTYQGSETPQVARALDVFSKQGLRVEVQELAGAAKVMEALLGGSADVILGTFDQVLQVRAQGQDVVAFRLISQCHCLGLIAPVASKIEKIADLKGRVVGVAAPGGPMQNFVVFLLHRLGLPAEDVSFASIGIGPSAVAAVEHGKVDAAVVFYGAESELRRRGVAMRTLAETFTREGSRAALGDELFPSTSLLARESWLRAHPAAARGLARAFTETVTWMKNSSIEEVRLRLSAEGRPSDPEIDRATLRLLIPALSGTGRFTPGIARLSFNVLAASRAEVRGIENELDKASTNDYL